MEPAKHPTSPEEGSYRPVRFCAGDYVTPRELSTIRSQPVRVPGPNSWTHLQFRRFASCPVCNLHLRSVALRYEEIVAAGIQEIVVFHSTAEAMLPHQGQLPFAAIADPEQGLYAEFGVEFSLRSVLHPRVWSTALKPYAWSVANRERRANGGSWRSTPGDSVLGLPADFLLAPDGRIEAVKYGKHADDQWSVDELLDLTPEHPAK